MFFYPVPSSNRYLPFPYAGDDDDNKLHFFFFTLKKPQEKIFSRAEEVCYTEVKSKEMVSRIISETITFLHFSRGAGAMQKIITNTLYLGRAPSPWIQP